MNNFAVNQEQKQQQQQQLQQQKPKQPQTQQYQQPQQQQYSQPQSYTQPFRNQQQQNGQNEIQYSSTRKFGLQYQLGKLLGKGSEGDVYQGTVGKTNEKVAIKIQMRMTDIEKSTLEKMMEKEFKHIINIRDLICEKGKQIVVMDFADGEFYQYMGTDEFQLKSKKEKNEFFYQIVCGVTEFHREELIHRDLKPENVVFLKQGQKIILKLCDFGLVKKQNANMTIGIGTPYYQAPELLSNKFYTEKVDIWALGMIWYEMIVGETMLNGQSVIDIQSKIKQLNERAIVNLIENTKKFNPGEQEILKNLLKIQPVNRWTAQKLKAQLELKLISAESGILTQVEQQKHVQPQIIVIQPQTFINQGQLRNQQSRQININSANQQNIINQQLQKQQQIPLQFLPEQKQITNEKSNEPSQAAGIARNLTEIENKQQAILDKERTEIEEEANNKLQQQLEKVKQDQEKELLKIKQDLEIATKQQLNELLQQEKQKIQEVHQILQAEKEKKLRDEYEQKIGELKKQTQDVEKNKQLLFEQQIKMKNEIDTIKQQEKQQAEQKMKEQEEQIKKQQQEQFQKQLKQQEELLKQQYQKEVYQRCNQEYNLQLQEQQRLERKKHEEFFKDRKQNIIIQINTSSDLLSNWLNSLVSRQHQEKLMQFQEYPELNQYKQYVKQGIEQVQSELNNIKLEQQSLSQVQFNENDENLHLFSQKYSQYAQNILIYQNQQNTELQELYNQLTLRQSMQEQQQKEQFKQQQKKEIGEIQQLKQTTQNTFERLEITFQNLTTQQLQFEKIAQQYEKYDDQLLGEVQKLKEQLNKYTEFRMNYLIKIQVQQENQSLIQMYQQFQGQLTREEQNLKEADQQLTTLSTIQQTIELRINQEINNLVEECNDKVDEALAIYQYIQTEEYKKDKSIDVQFYINTISKKCKELQIKKQQLRSESPMQQQLNSPLLLEALKDANNKLNQIKFVISELDEEKMQLESKLNGEKILRLLIEEKEKVCSQLQLEFNGEEKKLNNLKRQIEYFKQLITQNKIDVGEIDMKKSHLNSLSAEFSYKWKQLTIEVVLNSKEDLEWFVIQSKSLIQSFVDQVEAEAATMVELKQNIETLLQQQISNSQNAFDQAKQLQEMILVDVEKLMRSYQAFDEFTKFKVLKDCNETQKQLQIKLDELQKMFQTGLLDQQKMKQMEITIKKNEMISQKQKFIILEKLNTQQKEDLYQLEQMITYCKNCKIQFTFFDIDIDSEIKRLQDEEKQILDFQLKLNEDYQKIEELQNNEKYDEVIQFTGQFNSVYSLKQNFNKPNYESQVSKWQRLQKYLQQQLQSYITAKSLLIIIALYHAKRLAKRLKRDAQKFKKRSQLQEKIMHDQNQQQQVNLQKQIDIILAKTKCHENIIQNQQWICIQADEIQPQLQQDFEEATQIYNDLFSKIKTLDLVKLRAFIKDQKFRTEIVTDYLPTLEVNEIQLYEKIFQAK